MASDLVGLSAMPFSQNQARSEDRHNWSVVNCNAVTVIGGRQSYVSSAYCCWTTLYTGAIADKGEV